MKTYEREPWETGGTDYVQVWCRLDELVGEGGADFEKAKRLYEAAKSTGDFRAAYELVIWRRSEAKIEALKEVASRLKTSPLYVYPRKLDAEGTQSRSDRPSNALPVMLARYLKGRVGGEVSANIIQSSMRRRTKMSRLVRLLFPPRFRGKVEPGRAYILIDDVISSGALFASLRSHIVRGGGRVVAMVALAHVSGRDQSLAITAKSIEAIDYEFGAGFEEFWQSKFGHGVERMTEQEAIYLLGRWRSEHPGVGRGDGLLDRLKAEIEQIEAAHLKKS